MVTGPSKKRFGLSSSGGGGRGRPSDLELDSSPSKEELRDQQLATSSASPPEHSDGPHWDMGRLEEQEEEEEQDTPTTRMKKSSRGSSEPKQPSSPPGWKTTKKSSSATRSRASNSSSTHSRTTTSTTTSSNRQQQQPSSQSKTTSSSSRNPSSSSAVKAQKIASSAGTSRLNRILHQPSVARVSYVPDHNRNETNNRDNDDEFAALATQRRNNNNHKSQSNKNKDDALPPVPHPTHATHVGNHVVQHGVIPALKVVDGGSNSSSSISLLPQQQECLLSMRCKAFEITKHSERVALSALQDPSGYAKHKRRLGLLWKTTAKKQHNKLRFVMILRSSNRPLQQQQQQQQHDRNKQSSRETKDSGTTKRNPSEEEEGSYEHLYQEDDEQGAAEDPADTSLFSNADGHPFPSQDMVAECCSFPVLVCLALHRDGTNPDVRKLISLQQLTAIQDVVSDNTLQLMFEGGDSVWLDFSEEYHHHDDVDVGESVTEGSGDNNKPTAQLGLSKEKFIWSLLQIHAMLVTSVLEKTKTTVQPLSVRNLDRAELQYAAQVNGFLHDSPMLCALLDRQREIHRKEEEEAKAEDDDKDLAYDILMGNYTTRVALFASEEEKTDAEEVLNGISEEMPQEQEEEGIDRLGDLLELRMRDLESETCRRLIAWEDEKHYSLLGQSAFDDSVGRDTTVDSLSLSALFQTLELLDRELGDMEDWLEDRAAVIQPLTDDCRDIEEENRQLEQQWKSYDMLGTELRRLLQGVDIDRKTEKILKNPASALVYDDSGDIDVAASERGVDQIYAAGVALKDAIDNAKKAGGVHLLAVSERVENLNASSDSFCNALAQIVVTVMEQLKTEVVAASDHGKVSKHDTHTMIAKKVRDTQRKFQSALLGYMKLIEILALLKPRLLPAIRDAYSEMVAEGILMKKRMKGYFQALPGKNTAYLAAVSHDMKDYSPYGDVSGEKKVNATDIGAALGELLPVVAREAYFTSALFGLSNKAMDGREKKRNFESAKRSVDHSTQYFRYYIQRTCGIIEGEVELASGGRIVRGDPMLSMVASIYLNEAMDQYIDREKKGGDQSLSLAYVRATILGLRKKVDKQWVAWVEEQIDWIKSNPGVPATGKRAGIFMSFARFPTYLDHVLLCSREGKRDGYTPEFSKIQVVSYYLQKMANTLLESLRVCAERESTDQQYAANVMRMENTYYFNQKIKDKGPEMSELFQKQLTRAGAICKQSTDAYLGWMIKKEFKPLYALFSQVSRVRRDVGDKDVPIHVSRATFVKTLQKESNREVMKEKVNLIYDRMEKHLSEDGGLLPIAWKALVKILYEWFGRWEKLSMQCYNHVLEPSAVDIVRLAKQVGSAGSTTANSNPAAQVTRVKQKPVPDQGQFAGRRLFGK